MYRYPQLCPSLVAKTEQASMLSPFANELPTFWVLGTCLIIALGWQKRDNWYSPDRLTITRYSWLFVLFFSAFLGRPTRSLDAMRTFNFETDCRNPDYALSEAELQQFQQKELCVLFVSLVMWCVTIARKTQGKDFNPSRARNHPCSPSGNCKSVGWVLRAVNNTNIAWIFTNPISVSRLMIYSMNYRVEDWLFFVICVSLFQITWDFFFVKPDSEKLAAQFVARESNVHALPDDDDTFERLSDWVEERRATRKRENRQLTIADPDN